MKKIIEARNRGEKDEPLSENAGRLQKIAYRIGQRSAREAQAYNEALESAHMRIFNHAVEVAVGPNKKALEIIRAVAQIPNQGVTTILDGTDFLNKDGTKKLRRQWYIFLHHGAPKDFSRSSWQTPVAQELGSFEMDNISWVRDSVKEPIDNIAITCEAPYSDQGEIMPAKTGININTRPYGAVQGFAKGSRIDINPDGSLAAIGVTRKDFGGYVDQDPSFSSIGVDALLDGVLGSVNKTVQEYQHLDQFLKDPGQS